MSLVRGLEALGWCVRYAALPFAGRGLPQVLDELQNGVVVRTFDYGLMRISENQQVGGVWTPSFYGYDGHGSVRYLTNATGAITDTYNYDAFGNMISSTGATPNEFYFAGEQFDSSLNLYYMRARYYRPQTGRFWTVDPIEGRLCCGMSWNPYLYARSNPVDGVDPTGRGTAERVATLATLLVAADVGYNVYRYGQCVGGILEEVGSALTHFAPQFGPSASEIGECGVRLVKGIIWPFPGKPPF